MSAPKVSVIIPAYNAERYIYDTIQSCVDQTLADIEIIVVDDGSRDKTPEIIGSFADHRIRLIRKANGGVSSARNKALEIAKGRYIQFLDADDILDPDKLREQSNYLLNAGDDGISTSKWGWFVADPADVTFIRAADWQDLDPVEFLITKFGGKGLMPPNSWLVPRALIGDVRFHSSIDTFEDGLFLAEITRRSKRVYFCETAISYYRKQNSASLTSQINFPNVVRSYMSTNLITDIMLQTDQGERMRVAAANALMKCALRSYPFSTALAREAERKAIALGPPNFNPVDGGGLFGSISKIVGWKMASKLRRHFSGVTKAIRSR